MLFVAIIQLHFIQTLFNTYNFRGQCIPGHARFNRAQGQEGHLKTHP